MTTYRFDKQKVAERFKMIMDKSSLTQAELAQMLSVSQPTISHYLNGRLPTADVLYALAKLGNTTIEWILSGKKEHTFGIVTEDKPKYHAKSTIEKEWQKLTPKAQKHFLGLIRMINKSAEEENSNEK